MSYSSLESHIRLVNYLPNNPDFLYERMCVSLTPLITYLAYLSGYKYGVTLNQIGLENLSSTLLTLNFFLDKRVPEINSYNLSHIWLIATVAQTRLA